MDFYPPVCHSKKKDSGLYSARRYAKWGPDASHRTGVKVLKLLVPAHPPPRLITVATAIIISRQPLRPHASPRGGVGGGSSRSGLKTHTFKDPTPPLRVWSHYESGSSEDVRQTTSIRLRKTNRGRRKGMIETRKSNERNIHDP